MVLILPSNLRLKAYLYYSPIFTDVLWGSWTLRDSKCKVKHFLINLQQKSLVIKLLAGSPQKQQCGRWSAPRYNPAPAGGGVFGPRDTARPRPRQIFARENPLNHSLPKTGQGLWLHA